MVNPHRILALFCFGLTSLLQGEPVDWLYTARYVVTMDSQHRILEDGAIALRGERIIAVGPRIQLEKKFEPAHRLARPEALIMPGLINTHTHAAMSLFRGVADDLRLQDWLEKYIFPAEAKNVTPEFVLWGTRLACLEMMLSGTTTFVDMYYFEDRVAEAAKEAGLRGVLGETIIGFPVPDAKSTDESLAFTEKFIQRYKNDRLIVPTVAPHALYTNSDIDLRRSRKLANKYGVPMVIHLSETKRENDESIAKRGMSPARVLDAIGALDGPTIAAHGVWLDDADIDILKKHNTGIAHCPSSNMKLGSGIAPVLKLLARGIPVGVGTDGPAGSNNDFDLMEEMNLASDLQKVASLDPTALPARQSIELATSLGAKVIGMDKEIGSIESGKRADIISLRLDRPHAVPLYNIYSQIVYALKASDVQDVTVNGRLIVRDGQSLTLQQAVILAKSKEYNKKVAASLK